jgi:hypothetical protein
MRIIVSTGLSALRAAHFMKGQQLRNKDDPMVRFTLVSERTMEEPVHHEHWNRCHVQSRENDNLPSVWTDFHTQEMLRCLMEFMEADPGSSVPSALLYQRAGFVHSLLQSEWVGATQSGGEHETTHREFLQNLPGVESSGRNKWCRDTEPKYAIASKDSEWAIVVDARTTRQLKTDVGHSTRRERLRLYSSGLRLVKADAIEPNATMMSFDELLLGGDVPFNAAQYIRFWLEQAKELPERDTEFFTYQPAIEVENRYAFCHPLYGKRGSMPMRGDISVLASGPPLTLRIDGKEVNLIIKFLEVEDGYDRLANIGFEVTENERSSQLGLHPDHLGLRFEKEDGDLSFTKDGELRRTLVTTMYRDLTKAFRICAKRSRNPDHEFEQTGGLGISAGHMFWSILTVKSEVHSDMKEAILRTNGWL